MHSAAVAAPRVCAATVELTESLLLLTSPAAAKEGLEKNLPQVFMPSCRFAAAEGGGTTFRVAVAGGDPTNARLLQLSLRPPLAAPCVVHCFVSQSPFADLPILSHGEA